MKYFIITVDTEGDNLWNWKYGDPISTENSLYIPRFQELCESFGFPPTYLTNYEMALEHRWVNYGRKKQLEGLCEIGMHLHAWNTPPVLELKDRYGGNPYITEFTTDAIEAKVHKMHEVLLDKFECRITSNRSGRWATNDTYLNIIRDLGITVDCSVTPGRSKNCGNDYSSFKLESFEIVDGLLEVPMTTMRTRMPLGGSIRQNLKALIKGESLWLRPIVDNKKLEYLCKKSFESCDYVEFMIHSSELMAGGSPYFPDEEAIDVLYKRIEALFTYLSNTDVAGITLSGYGTFWRENNNVDVENY